MARRGHDDVSAALIYQRATREADRRIADRVSDLVGEQRGPAAETDDDDGARALSYRQVVARRASNTKKARSCAR